MIRTFQGIDGDILIWIQEHIRNGILTPFFKSVTLLGNSGIFWIVLAVVLIGFKKTRKVGIMCLVALLFSFIINNLFLKNIVARTRPYEVVDGLIRLIEKPKDFSFPSGHTACSFTCATVICMNMKKKYGIAAFILAFLIAFSRLYLGVHYPSDVLMGVVDGIILGMLAVKIVELVIHRKTRIEVEE